MDATTPRLLPPGRIVALLLIALTVAGLTSVRLAPGEEPVTVPDGAEVGDLALEPCTYATEDGPAAADCGTLVVAEDPADPGSPRIALPVVRIHARSERPGEPIFWLEGGPGQTNLDLAQASRLTADHDVVLVGYRGIDGSVRLDCPEVESALSTATDLLDDASARVYSEAFSACADRLVGQGIDVTRYGLVQQVDDMEVARVALGYDRVNLLSESAGTRTAMIYAWRHPASINRSVMIAVNPPGHLVFDDAITDEQVDRFADLCREDTACSTRTDDLAATIRRTAADVPDRWWFLPIKDESARMLSFFGLMQSTTAMPPGREVTVEGWLAAAEGDPAALWLMSFIGDALYPKLFVWGQYAAAARVDADAAREYFADAGETTATANLGHAANVAAWGNGGLVDAWPAGVEEDSYATVRPSDVPTLLISGELDASTPPQVVTAELLPALRNGHEVVLAGFGHSPSFWAEQQDAGTQLLTAFLDDGRVDTGLYEPQGLDLERTMTLGTVARLVVATMLAWAALTVVSLVGMARRARRRGGFGPVAAAALRSAYPVVLGLGGWFLALLAITTVQARVPLDSAVLAVLAPVVPILLGVWLAWAPPSASATTRRRGLVLAGTGALVGGWLGFNAPSAAFAGLFLGIVGAIAGANLLLVVWDVATSRAGSQLPSRIVTPAREHVQA